MKRKIILLMFIVMAFSLLCVTTFAAVTGQAILGNVITGDAVEGATLYELYYITDAGEYVFVESAPTISFDLSDLSVGEYTFVVRAFGEGYLPSDYSNEVIYTVSDEEEAVYYSVSYEPNDHGQILADSFTVEAGRAFSGTISPYSGYGLPSVIYVSMNGVSLPEGSGFTYDSGTGAFTIESVTGNVYITYDAPSVTASAPALRLSGSVVSWNALPDAIDYHIRVMGTQTSYDQYFETAETSFDLSAIGLTEADSYTVAVWADTENGFGESAAITYIYGG